MIDHHREIEDLLYEYAERIDAGDFAGVGRLFARGQIVASSINRVFRGEDEVRGMYEMATRRYDDGTPRTQHVMSNVRIRLDTVARGAVAHLRFTVFQSLPDFPLQAIIAGRYEDRFARDDLGWHFAERKMFPELIGDLSRHLLITLPG
jgi:3-phenylpropionate/cinnamic acid dioxygenase small subunit